MQIVSDVARLTKTLAVDHGIWHRDYSPGNVLALDGRALLIDFSVGKVRAQGFLGDKHSDAVQAWPLNRCFATFIAQVSGWTVLPQQASGPVCYLLALTTLYGWSVHTLWHGSHS